MSNNHSKSHGWLKCCYKWSVRPRVRVFSWSIIVTLTGALAPRVISQRERITRKDEGTSSRNDRVDKRRRLMTADWKRPPGRHGLETAQTVRRR